MSIVSVQSCASYDPAAVRQAVMAALNPLGGMAQFVRPGMRVLLKPNLINDAPRDRAVTTHPAIVQAVAELVQEAGGVVRIGDSPAGSTEATPRVYQGTGMVEVAERTGAQLVPFEPITWQRLNGADYFIATPVLEADLIINLPKLKTHVFTLYTGAVKNLFGIISGTRKRDIHYRAVSLTKFSQALVDVLALTRPGLTIMDGVLGLEGNGPGTRGIPRPYECVAASADPVALDTVLSGAMGCAPGRVLHLQQAAARDLGTGDRDAIQVMGAASALDFGPVRLPGAHRLLGLSSKIGTPLRLTVRHQPRLDAAACIGCGRCSEACPAQVITPGRPAAFDLDRCIGCLCCIEVCPQGAIAPSYNLTGRLITRIVHLFE
ncbi:MAG: DUF362 domain-containing protein [Chloroflexi bacterium]|nr:DUF362 domain-containing protein [Chloroflexota bacterium]MBU1751195.1 DUF362 domain-containing protein [Chloroflexota bacterium]